MELLYIILGTWIGLIFTFFQWYIPMEKKINDLEEGMKDCIKSGLNGPINYGSIEKDMD